MTQTRRISNENVRETREEVLDYATVIAINRAIAMERLHGDEGSNYFYGGPEVPLYLPIEYVTAAGRGAISGVVGIVNTIIHPIDNIIYPTYSFLHDTQILNAANFAGVPDIVNGFENTLLQNAIFHDPDIYFSAASRMQDREDRVVRTMQTFVNGSGPQQTEMLASAITGGVFLGGLASVTMRAASNFSRFGTILPAQQFPGWGGYEVRSPLSLVSALDNRRHLAGERIISHKITEHGPVIFTSRFQPVINEHSGFYLPHGERVEILAARLYKHNAYYHVNTFNVQLLNENLGFNLIYNESRLISTVNRNSLMYTFPLYSTPSFFSDLTFSPIITSLGSIIASTQPTENPEPSEAPGLSSIDTTLSTFTGNFLEQVTPAWDAPFQCTVAPYGLESFLQQTDFTLNNLTYSEYPSIGQDVTTPSTAIATPAFAPTTSSWSDAFNTLVTSSDDSTSSYSQMLTRLGVSLSSGPGIGLCAGRSIAQGLRELRYREEGLAHFIMDNLRNLRDSIRGPYSHHPSPFTQGIYYGSMEYQLNQQGRELFSQLYNYLSESTNSLISAAVESTTPSVDAPSLSSIDTTLPTFTGDSLEPATPSWDAPFQCAVASYGVENFIQQTDSTLNNLTHSEYPSIGQDVTTPNTAIGTSASAIDIFFQERTDSLSFGLTSTPSPTSSWSDAFNTLVTSSDDSTSSYSQMLTRLGVSPSSNGQVPSCTDLWDTNNQRLDALRTSLESRQSICTSLLGRNCSLAPGFFSRPNCRVEIDASGEFAYKPLEKHSNGGGNGQGSDSSGGRNYAGDSNSWTGIEGAFDVSCDYGGGGYSYA